MTANRPQKLSVEAWAQIDELCDQFEQLWEAGKQPRIERFLEACAEGHRRWLLSELLPIELHYRTQAGEAPSLDEYEQRFPNYRDVVEPLLEDRESVVGFTEQPTQTGESQTETTPPQSPSSIASQALGQYQLLEKLGQGGMGRVYKAYHPHLGQVFAIKVLPPEVLRSDKAVRRFRREMRALGRMSHPHIVRATDAGEVDGVQYLVMEYVEGRDFAQIVKQRGAVPYGLAAELIRQAALGLQHAHENGLVHRDIKPSNFLLSRTGIVKLLDLGLAWIRGDEEQAVHLTATHQLVGTPDFIAPEFVRGQMHKDGKRHIDIRGDIYSLGCTLYALLTGLPPYADHEHSSIYAKLKAHVEEPPPPLEVKCPEIPPEMCAVVQRMLAKDPAQRYATPAEVAEALAPFSSKAELARLGIRVPQEEASFNRSMETARSLDRVEALTEASFEPGKRRDSEMIQIGGQDDSGPTADTLSSPDLGPRRRRRGAKWMPAAIFFSVLALLSFGSIAWLVSDLGGGSSGRLSINEFQLSQFRDQQPVGKIGRDSFLALAGDQIRVAATLSEPAYVFVLAFPADGGDVELCFPTDPNQPPPQVSEVACPLQEDLGFEMRGAPGLQMFAVVASRDPLPSYKKWRDSIGILPWQKMVSDTVWHFDGRRLKILEADPLNANKPTEEEARLLGNEAEDINDILKKIGIDAVHALTFPVREPPESESP